MNNERIGLLDSGLGGMTVLRRLRERCPGPDYIYFADTRYLPYGEKSREMLRKRAKELSIFFKREKIDRLLLACNTITATALDVFEKELGIPVYGVVEYGAGEAKKCSDGRPVGLLATDRTVKSGAYQHYMEGFPFTAAAAPELVFFAERGVTDSPELEKYIRRYTESLEADTIILGCTHFPVLLPAFQNVLPDTLFIDPAISMAKAVARDLDCRGEGTFRFYTSKKEPRYPEVLKKIFGYDIPVTTVDL